MSFEWITPELITAVAGCATAIASGIVAIVSAKKASKLEKRLEEAKQRETYIICPHCKKKTPLSEVDFRLPDGSLDNNLNGKPDIEE